jgi:hypothetical protein
MLWRHRQGAVQQAVILPKKNLVKPSIRVFRTSNHMSLLTKPAPIQRLRASDPIENKSQNRGKLPPQIR